MENLLGATMSNKLKFSTPQANMNRCLKNIIKPVQYMQDYSFLWVEVNRDVKIYFSSFFFVLL